MKNLSVNSIVQSNQTSTKTFVIADENRKLPAAALTNSPIFPVSTHSKSAKSSKEIFFNLLVFLELNLHLKDMFESLKELQIAVSNEETHKIYSIVNHCIKICLNCEIYSAIGNLRRLTRKNNIQQYEIAEALVKEIRIECENFSLLMQKNLESFVNSN